MTYQKVALKIGRAYRMPCMETLAFFDKLNFFFFFQKKKNVKRT